MEQKTWLWKKKLSEKPIVANGKADILVKENGEEIRQNEKEVALTESLKMLNEKLESVISERDAKNLLVSEHMKKTEIALAGKEKAEAEVLNLKEKLDEALKEKATENERIGLLNTALKDCMQQLNSTREGQDQRVQDALATTLKELETMNKKFTNLTNENSQLHNVLIELNKFKTQAQTEFNALMERLDLTEKENGFLRYEFRMLEKELDIQNEDRRFTRYSLEASEKRNLESIKKIKKLEGECQRLRVLVRKRLPGPARGLVLRDSTMESPPDNPILVEKLRDLDEENKVLREVLVSKLGLESKLISCGSSVSSSLSEIELSKNGNVKNTPESKTLGISDMSLMDDFVEMEKLAIVAVDSQNDITSSCKELAIVAVDSQDDHDWLQRVSNIILEQNRVSGKTIKELLEEFVTSLNHTNSEKLPAELPVTGLIGWKSPVESPGASEDLETRLQAEIVKNVNLQAELQTERESKRMMEEQIESQKSAYEDLDTQLTVARAKVNETSQKLSSLEIELEHKSQCCEELEGTCLELQLQLESISYNEARRDSKVQEVKVLQTGWEISAASAKLDECQDAILQLGKQLKAITSPNSKKLNHRLSLLDRMQFEDSNEVGENMKPKGPTRNETGLEIVLSKKRGGSVGFLKKLLMRKKNGSRRQKASFYLTT